MIESWRWYGPFDKITLPEIAQTGATGIVTALHEIPYGEVWPTDLIAARKAEIEARLREEVALRDEQVARLSQEAKDLSVTRAPVAARIPAPLLALYEKYRASSGLGAAALKAGRCSGCQLQLNVSDLDTYRRAPANQVLRCVECERILVRTAESGL